MDHYQQTYSYCMYCLDMFPSGTLEHHLHSVCAGYRLAMERNIQPLWILSQVNNIDNQTPHGVSLGTGSNFEEGQNENVSYIQNIITDSHQPSNDDFSSTEPTVEESQNENDTYSQDNIMIRSSGMDCHQPSCSRGLSTEPTSEELQNENVIYPQENIMDVNQPSSDDVSSTEPNYEEPQNENDTYSQDNIMDCQQTSCSGDLSTEPNCEESQDENGHYNWTSRDGSLTELNFEEPQDEMDGNYICNDCPTCSRCKRNHRYGSKGRLIWHIQTSHLSHYQRLYSCDEHQLLFINRKTLREHMKTDHRKRKNNIDKNPPAQTSNSAAQDETTPEENCSKSFTTKCGLNRHQKEAHQPKNLQCNECSKKVCGNLFTEIGSWRFHQLTHPRQ
ncbi:hypothetical protein TKK_0003305 [Trichogramma kaykai]